MAFEPTEGRGGSTRRRLMLQNRLEALDQDLRHTMTESARTQQTSSHHMTGAVRDVTDRLSKIEETNKQVLNFSGQLENLQRILTNPKQRGILGEYYLETLLKNVFAPDHEMQYKFFRRRNRRRRGLYFATRSCRSIPSSVWKIITASSRRKLTRIASDMKRR